MESPKAIFAAITTRRTDPVWVGYELGEPTALCFGDYGTPGLTWAATVTANALEAGQIATTQTIDTERGA